jgi:hypothetical protein
MSKAFPTIVVDDFYEDPKQVVEFANSLEYSNDTGNYPGVRSPDLHLVDYDFFQYSANNWLELFWDINLSEVEWTVASYFQKITPFSENPSDIINSGWVHSDVDAIAAAVIYLNEDSSPQTGTSICKPLVDAPKIDNDERFKLYKDGIATDQYRSSLYKNQKQFVDTVTVDNYYNRMITFDATSYHRVRSFYTEDSNPRLTQVLFLNKVNATRNPSGIRSKQWNWNK